MCKRLAESTLYKQDFVLIVEAGKYSGGKFGMHGLSRLLGGFGMVVAGLSAPPLSAQSPSQGAASPSGSAVIDPSSIPLPDLAFVPDEEDIRNYDKYFYFHRDNTDFATAYSDLQECDAYARGITLRADGSPFTGALTGAAMDAVFGSAERRRIRRVNMRVCMRYKEYRLYGLPKSLWERFNFSEGLTRVDESERQRLLRIQARVASGPRPSIGEIAR